MVDSQFNDQDRLCAFISAELTHRGIGVRPDTLSEYVVAYVLDGTDTVDLKDRESHLAPWLQKKRLGVAVSVLYSMLEPEMTEERRRRLDTLLAQAHH